MADNHMVALRSLHNRFGQLQRQIGAMYVMLVDLGPEGPTATYSTSPKDAEQEPRHSLLEGAKAHFSGIRRLQLTDISPAPISEVREKEDTNAQQNRSRELWWLCDPHRDTKALYEIFLLDENATNVLHDLRASADFQLLTRAHQVWQRLVYHYETRKGKKRVTRNWTHALLLAADFEEAIHWYALPAQSADTSEGPALVAFGAQSHDAGLTEPIDVLSASMSLLEQLMNAYGEPTDAVQRTTVRIARPIEPVDHDKLDSLRHVRDQVNSGRQYIGESLPILQMFARIARLNAAHQPQYRNRGPTPVLLLGPSGVGKSHLARLVHDSSDRAKPHNAGFEYRTASDIRASDEAVVRCDWAGYAPGAIAANADRKGRKGLLQKCHEGTIFLDEVHDCPVWFQQFLFRVLDGHSIPPATGDSSKQGWEPAQQNVRFVFASNLPADQLRQTLRHDFWRRIQPYIVEVPPLSDRPEDVLCFIQEWLWSAAGDKSEGSSGAGGGENHRRNVRELIDYRLILAMLDYEWPGEVRELGQFLEEVCADAGTARPITPDHLQGASETSRTLRLIARAIDAGSVEAELYRELSHLFMRRGFRKGDRRHPLHEEMAKFLGVDSSRVSRMPKQ